MSKKVSTFIFFIFVLFHKQLLLASDYSIAFGSCLDQRKAQPIWHSIEKMNPNAFIFLGDNVYGDHPSQNLAYLYEAYDQQETKLPRWLNTLKIYSIWDDHDYGLNDGGASFMGKKESQNIFIDFWGIDPNDQRAKREGIYFSEKLVIQDLNIKIIGLDTRYFRSDLKGNKNFYLNNNDENASILGATQWQWLENEFNEEVDLVILLSSIQVLSTDHRFEKWSLFPAERDKLIKLINNSSNKTLILSGDRHRAGMYKLDEIIEITSSSMNKPIKTFSEKKGFEKYFDQAMDWVFYEDDELALDKTYIKENFGFIKIYSEQKLLELNIFDINGKSVLSHNLKLSKS